MNANKRKKTRAARRTRCKAAGLAIRNARAREMRRAMAAQAAIVHVDEVAA